MPSEIDIIRDELKVAKALLDNAALREKILQNKIDLGAEPYRRIIAGLEASVQGMSSNVAKMEVAIRNAGKSRIDHATGKEIGAMLEEGIKEMLKRTIAGCFDADHDNPIVEIETMDSDSVKFTVGQMYEYLAIKPENLEALGRVLGTDEINLGDQSAEGGCESCDYGSNYYQEFTAYNVMLPLNFGWSE